MQEIRARIGFSLQELELCLLNSLRNAFRAAYTECVGCQHISGHSVKRHPSQPSRCRGSTIR